MSKLFALLFALAFAIGCAPSDSPQKLGASPIEYQPIQLGLPTAAQKTAYAATTAWYLSASGSASATGTDVSHPIPLAEVSRRLYGLTLTAAGDVVFNIDATGDSAHPLCVTWNTPAGSQTHIKGTSTSVLTGSVTTWRTAVPSTQTYWGLTDSALGSANAWTAQVGRRIDNTTAGARLGTVAWVAKDEGSKVARVSAPAKIPTAYPFGAYNYARTPFVNGDTYAVKTLSPLGGLVIVGSQDVTAIDNQFSPKVIVEDVSFPPYFVNAYDNGPIAFVNSAFNYIKIEGGDYSVVVGSYAVGINIYGGNAVVTGTTIGGGGVVMTTGATVTWTDILLQGSGSYFSCSGQSYAYVQGDVAVFDSGTNALILSGGVNWKGVGASWLFGNGNTFGIVVNDGSQFHWGSQKPNITGTTADTQVDGTNVAWASAPYTDKATGSALYSNGIGGGRSSSWITFGAFASLTTAAAQAIPPGGSGATTSTTDLVQGIIAPAPGSVSALYIRYTGSASNVAGQTTTVKLQKNGVDATGASVASIATTAGNKTGTATFTPVTYVAGDIITAVITPSALLTAALTDVMVGAQ